MPGMVCAALGADVLLTDKPDVVPYVEQRVADNFPGGGVQEAAAGSARVAALTWDLESARRLLRQEGGFDLVICSDGVYAPLYPSSCTGLAEVVHHLCGPSTIAVISFCRRPPQHSEARWRIPTTAPTLSWQRSRKECTSRGWKENRSNWVTPSVRLRSSRRGCEWNRTEPRGAPAQRRSASEKPRGRA
ncbi:unnamed protein product [Prorocentrum cordatum]|uniref:Calmodulin-lysine N-methyltransferase n=1 Tax=Prorocentrum cordatum TaxID=2364126 RepID=A0ABN9S757_9DINO|nr:unnamed protein product [Polarella glacialis]